MTRLHPFDITVLLLVATALLPIGTAWQALVWIATIVAGTLVLRRIGHERKTELSRATMVRDQIK